MFLKFMNLIWCNNNIVSCKSEAWILWYLSGMRKMCESYSDIQGNPANASTMNHHPIPQKPSTFLYESNVVIAIVAWPFCTIFLMYFFVICFLVFRYLFVVCIYWYTFIYTIYTYFLFSNLLFCYETKTINDNWQYWPVNCTFGIFVTLVCTLLCRRVS